LATVHPGKTSHSMVLEKDSIFFVFAFKLIVEQFLDLLADLTINKHYLAPLTATLTHKDDPKASRFDPTF
jgi:hypothetical protein